MAEGCGASSTCWIWNADRCDTMLRGFKPAQRTGARAEAVDIDAGALQHADEEIGQRRRIGAFEGEMLAVAEAAAREEDGQVARRMAARVAEVAREEHAGAVEQRAP